MLPIKEKLDQDLREAMRQGDVVKRSVIRMVKSAVVYDEKAKGRTLDEDGVREVLARQVRQHRESIAEFGKGNRPDLVQQEEAELAILLQYLPPQMSRGEIQKIAQKVISEVGARGLNDKGRVMGKLMPQLKGRAQGSDVNQVVEELLSAASSA